MSQPDPIPSICLRAVQVTGPDAIAFMQSQLTIDVGAIADTSLHPAAWCRPDGRVETVILVGVDGENVWLLLPEALMPQTLKRARMFSIGRQVSLGPEVFAQPIHAPFPAQKTALKLSVDPERALLPGAPGGESGEESTQLSTEWLKADIDCTMPWILPETAGAYLPQMLGLERLGGLSYKKGCFPGQEVIARVHYRGRVTRRTVRFRLAADSPPQPGSEFEHAGKPAQVLYAVADSGESGSAIGLAVVAAETEDGAKIDIGTASGELF